jgi:DNA polymerase-3 subunit alpha
LRTLTIIKWALEMINPRRLAKGQGLLDISDIPLDDPASFRMLKRAETTAVFQLESRGMKDLIRRLQPDNIEDMIALVALFRPGPLESGMVDDFINRKHGRAQVAYPHPDYQHMSLKPILEATYGVIVYQEQVMQIAQVLSGYTLGGADMLRRAMGKKKPEEMAKQRAVFAEGAAGQGVDPDLAMKIFDLVEKFAGYGFNKSHSAAYAIVSYQTLWLKVHYPAEFMAAVLTADMQNTDKVVTLIEECRKMKLELVLPDVNTSEFTFTVNDQGKIVYGLGAIKGLGEGPVASIQEMRKQGKFTNFFDFCARVDARKVNKRALEALIRSGALDSIGPSRARLMASIEEAVQRADQNNRNVNAGMDDLFGEVVPDQNDHEDLYASTQHVREWSDKDRLNGEKETLGLYLTGHPFDEYETEIRQFASTAIVDLKPKKDSQTIAGLVVSFRTMKSKKGDTMAFLVLDDRSARIEVALFADIYQQSREALRNDAILIIEGEVGEDRHNGGLKITARKLYDITAARLQNAKGLMLKINASALARGTLQELQDTLSPYRDAESCPVFVQYVRHDAKSLLQMGEGWRVVPADELVQGLKYALGAGNVMLKYH